MENNTDKFMINMNSNLYTFNEEIILFNKVHFFIKYTIYYHFNMNYIMSYFTLYTNVVLPIIHFPALDGGSRNSLISRNNSSPRGAGVVQC